MYLRNTHFSISHSFLDIPLISRYLTHFSISHSFLDIFYIKGFVKSWTRSNRGGYARVDCGVEAIVGSQKSTRQGSQKVHVNGLKKVHVKGLKKVHVKGLKKYTSMVLYAISRVSKNLGQH